MMKIMTTIILVLVVGLIVQLVYSNEGILSKFHQNRYKLRDVRVLLISYDEGMFNIFEIKAFKYNRTTTAHNFTVNLKVDAKDDIEILVQAYKFLSNEYRRIAIRFQVNFKKAVDANAIGLRELQNCGNMTNFYYYKDITYYSCNFVIDETRFPPLIPDGRYKVEATYLYFHKEVAVTDMFCEVYTPIAYPKK